MQSPNPLSSPRKPNISSMVDSSGPMSPARSKMFIRLDSEKLYEVLNEQARVKEGEVRTRACVCVCVCVCVRAHANVSMCCVYVQNCRYAWSWRRCACVHMCVCVCVLLLCTCLLCVRLYVAVHACVQCMCVHAHHAPTPRIMPLHLCRRWGADPKSYSSLMLVHFRAHTGPSSRALLSPGHLAQHCPYHCRYHHP